MQPKVSYRDLMGALKQGAFAFFFAAKIGLATELPPATSPYDAARHVERTYLAGLKLKGQTAETFMRTMLREGFRCSIEAVNPSGIDLPPHASCDKSVTEYGLRCPTLRVLASFPRSRDVQTQRDLHARLATTVVSSTSVSCMRPYPISPEYLAAKEQAELEFGQKVEAVARMPTAKDAFDYLLVDGYYCGITRKSTDTDGIQQPVGLTCYRFRTGIRFCFRGNIVLDAQWPQGLRTFDEHFDALAAARITGMKVSCEIPAIEGGGKPT